MIPIFSFHPNGLRPYSGVSTRASVGSVRIYHDQGQLMDEKIYHSNVLNTVLRLSLKVLRLVFMLLELRVGFF